MHVAQLDIFDADGCEPGPVSEVPEIQTKKIAASRNPGFFQDWKTNSLTRALTHSRTHARTHARWHQQANSKLERPSWQSFGRSVDSWGQNPEGDVMGRHLGRLRELAPPTDRLAAVRIVDVPACRCGPARR